VSQTEAVEDSVRRRLDELKNDADHERKVERILALGAEISRHVDVRSHEDVNDWLYDENGLPT